MSSGLVGKEKERRKRLARSLFPYRQECALNQTSSGYFVNGHYAIQSPLSYTQIQDTISGRLDTPPVYVDLCVKEIDESQWNSLAKTEASFFLKHPN